MGPAQPARGIGHPGALLVVAQALRLCAQAFCVELAIVDDDRRGLLRQEGGVRPLMGAGVQYFTIQTLDAADEETLRLLATELAPAMAG